MGDTGIEPVTSSVSGKRATAAPIAQCCVVSRGGDGIRTRVNGFAGRCLASDDRQAAYEALRFVNRLTDSSLSYDPSFPVEGSLSVPKSHETRPLGIATLLEKSLEVPQELTAFT